MEGEDAFVRNTRVIRYHYAPTFPHGGAGLPPGSVKFKPEIVAQFAGR